MEAGFRYRRCQSRARLQAVAAADTLAGVATILCRCSIISMRQLMCTISFVPKLRGFYLAMNRDEKFTRSTALPPAIVDLADRRAIFPREQEGGTWIAANDAGVCLALINWHRVERQPVRSLASRGQFSICMHRRDAATVSYTEVAVPKRRATMRYKSGPCCSNQAMATKMISLPR